MKCNVCNSNLIFLYFRDYKYNQNSISNVGDIDSKARTWRRTKIRYCRKCKQVR